MQIAIDIDMLASTTYIGVGNFRQLPVSGLVIGKGLHQRPEASACKYALVELFQFAMVSEYDN